MHWLAPQNEASFLKFPVDPFSAVVSVLVSASFWQLLPVSISHVISLLVFVMAAQKKPSTSLCLWLPICCLFRLAPAGRLQGICTHFQNSHWCLFWASHLFRARRCSLVNSLRFGRVYSMKQETDRTSWLWLRRRSLRHPDVSDCRFSFLLAWLLQPGFKESVRVSFLRLAPLPREAL